MQAATLSSPALPPLETTQRYAGLLAPVFALRHADDLGIGDTRAVREALEFCAAHHFSILQLLPIHETVGDHSPYNPISSRALSPALLHLHPDEVPGLTREMLDQAAPESWIAELRQGTVKHNSVHALKLQILLWAHRHFRREHPPESTLAREFAAFQAEHSEWLRPYTLFRLLIREYEGNTDWHEWRPEHRSPPTAEAALLRHPDCERFEIIREGLAFVQWVAWRQWRAVRALGDKLGVRLMGEVSFGVSRCSVDVWANPELFDLDWNMGTRPIVYFDTNKDSERWGQNWGLPAYRWDNHRAQDFHWVRERLRGEAQFFHLCRLDHLRGYFRGYMFPWPGGAKHAEYAQLSDEEVRERTGGRMPRFVPGPDEDPASARENERQGREIFTAMKEAAGSVFLVGEIMGNMPPYMRRVLDELNIASLTFPHLERNADRSLQSPDTYRRLSLAAYANHDHAPMAAQFLHLNKQRQAADVNASTDLHNLVRLAGFPGEPPETFTDEFLQGLQRSLMETPCLLAVLMTSDVLGITQRYNLPGSYGAGTWSERLEYPLLAYTRRPPFSGRLMRLAELIRKSGRIPRELMLAAATTQSASPFQSVGRAQALGRSRTTQNA